MEQAPPAGPSPFGPCSGAPDSSSDPSGPAETAPPDEVPEVADAVGARAHGLREMAEHLHATVGGDLAGALRAHAGDIDALAEHLRDTGTPPSTPSAAVPPPS